MSFSIGSVGLPYVGKSTLFNALTGGEAHCSHFPFCTIDPNKAIVPVPDVTLEAIARYITTKKTTPTTLEVIDIAGLIEGSHKGEGLGNQFLSHVQKVDAIAHVVRLFADTHVSHVGEVDPVRDVEIVEMELRLKDLEILSKRRASIEKKAKSGDKELRKEGDTLSLLEKKISENIRISLDVLSEKERKIARNMGLISLKPTMIIANVGAESLKRAHETFAKLKAYVDTRGLMMLGISAKIEEEIVTLDTDERKAFLDEYGIKQGSLERLILAGYTLLDLITFYTFNENELRAWTLRKGSSVLDAAHTVHTDMAKGFIKAEVVQAAVFLEHKSMKDVKEKGLMNLEGKEYRVTDGDIVFIHFT